MLLSNSSKQKNYCLLANDSQFLLEAFKGGLEPHFDKIITAIDGKEAVDEVVSKPRSYFKVIILDICMPVMDGIEACIHIKKYLESQDSGD